MSIHLNESFDFKKNSWLLTLSEYESLINKLDEKELSKLYKKIINIEMPFDIHKKIRTMIFDKQFWIQERKSKTLKILESQLV